MFVRTLPFKRKMIIQQVKDHLNFLRTNAEKLDIYQGNLLPYIDQIMRLSLSPQYYSAIKHRVLPINVLQRYVDKVAVAYVNGPKRTANEDKHSKEFLEYYTKQFDMNSSGQIADSYAAMFKGFAWEPYLNNDNEPAIRELPFDRFLVISDSKVNPENETIFVKIMGNPDDVNGRCLLFAYTNTEFDAFYMDEMPAVEYLKDNLGENPIGTIPFVYGKRQKNKLIPTQDSDILAFTKAIPVMLSDAAGAQMFQCFTIIYGVDVNFANLKLAPNAFWDMKSDSSSDKEPKVGTINPTADTEKVVKFVLTAFVLWLETKGIRVGSVGTMDTGNLASGLSKIIDEMDVNNLVSKSMEWFEKDENVLWNKKLPKIHRYWVETQQLDPAKSCTIVDEPGIVVAFEKPEPTITRSVEIADQKSELELGTVEFEDVLKRLHPEYEPDKIKKLVALFNQKMKIKTDAKGNTIVDANDENEEGKDGVDEGDDSNSEKSKTDSTGSDS